MGKLKNVLVIASGSSIAELTCGAAQLGETVTLIYYGERDSAVNADRAIYIENIHGEDSIVMFAGGIADIALGAAPDLVIMDSSKNSRLIAAYIAAKSGAPVISGVSDIELDGDHVLAKRMVYGGAAIKTSKLVGMSVVCVSHGVFSAGETSPVNDISDVSAEPGRGVEMLGREAAQSTQVNLDAAKKVVGVGRGVPDEAALEMCRALAEKLGAEIGCTRPICEERRWMEKERYIGVSGVTVQPDYYIALGISGQVQHTVGINKSGVIIAVDKNESSLIFKNCDYGIVGDLAKVVPGLINLLDA